MGVSNNHLLIIAYPLQCNTRINNVFFKLTNTDSREELKFKGFY